MHSLQKVLTDLDYEVRSYSGRGMGGKQCLGVELPEGMFSFGAFVSKLIDKAFECGKYHIESDDYDWPSICEGINYFKTDDMGKGTILYFPGIPFSE